MNEAIIYHFHEKSEDIEAVTPVVMGASQSSRLRRCMGLITCAAEQR